MSSSDLDNILGQREPCNWTPVWKGANGSQWDPRWVMTDKNDNNVYLPEIPCSAVPDAAPQQACSHRISVWSRKLHLVCFAIILEFSDLSTLWIHRMPLSFNKYLCLWSTHFPHLHSTLLLGFLTPQCRMPPIQTRMRHDASRAFTPSESLFSIKTVKGNQMCTSSTW